MIYSCRAEFGCDVERFVHTAGTLCQVTRQQTMMMIDGRLDFIGPVVDVDQLQRLEGNPFPDIAIEFESSADLDTLRALLSKYVPDSHVMRQTLRACPLAGNPLERDWDIE